MVNHSAHAREQPAMIDIAGMIVDVGQLFSRQDIAAPAAVHDGAQPRLAQGGNHLVKNLFHIAGHHGAKADVHRRVACIQESLQLGIRLGLLIFLLPETRHVDIVVPV